MPSEQEYRAFISSVLAGTYGSDTPCGAYPAPPSQCLPFNPLYPPAGTPDVQYLTDATAVIEEWLACVKTKCDTNHEPPSWDMSAIESSCCAILSTGLLAADAALWQRLHPEGP